MSGLELDGKVAIVTGSGRGLGRAYAQALATAGASVLVNDLDAEAAEETAAAIGPSAVALAAPVGDTETAEALVARAVEAFGRLDIMVTNAGVLRDKVLWKMTDEDFDVVLQTHLRGTFTCARAAAIRMREQGEGGRIIVVGSPAGQFGNFGQTNYAAAKAGMHGFTKSLALEVAKKGVTVNTISPGFIATKMVTVLPQDVLDTKIIPQIPVGRLGQPAEVAALVLYLCSREAGFVTGANIAINGGQHLQ
jgi:NAD(P)-dependent dehydrogenase (short-subunit alcohol dehydrogenase family)